MCSVRTVEHMIYNHRYCKQCISLWLISISVLYKFQGRWIRVGDFVWPVWLTCPSCSGVWGIEVCAGGVSGQLRGAPKAVLQHPDLIPLLHVVCHVKQGEGTLLQGTQTEIQAGLWTDMTSQKSRETSSGSLSFQKYEEFFIHLYGLCAFEY